MICCPQHLTIHSPNSSRLNYVIGLAHEAFLEMPRSGVYDVGVENGRIVDVRGIDEDPEPSDIGQVLLDGVQHSSRIQRPAIRKGWLEKADQGRDCRGTDEFLDVLPWDEALELAANELRRVA